jgi:nucleoside-diphosphate-sugar epimerase
VVLPNFVSDALSNEPVPGFGPGTQSLCFADVKDFVHTLAGLALRDPDVRNVFSVGNA